MFIIEIFLRLCHCSLIASPSGLSKIYTPGLLKTAERRHSVKFLVKERWSEKSGCLTEKLSSDNKEHVHNRYLYLYKLLQNSNKKMALLFDGHSRSKAWIQLIAIRNEGLADEELLSKLSDEMLEETDPKRHGW